MKTLICIAVALSGASAFAANVERAECDMAARSAVNKEHRRLYVDDSRDWAVITDSESIEADTVSVWVRSGGADGSRAITRWEVTTGPAPACDVMYVAEYESRTL